MAIKAYAFITAKAGMSKAILDALKNIKNTTNVYPVTGRYDFIVTINADSINDLSKTIVTGIRKIEGVVKTETCIVTKK